MASYSSIVRQLDASRRLQQQLKLDRHQQQLEKQRINVQLESLRRSRKEFIQTQIQKSEKDYEQKLKEDPEVAKQYLERQKKSGNQRSKIAQSDFQRQRDQLNKERKAYDNLENQYKRLDRSILQLQNRSKIAHDTEQRRITELQLRRKQLAKQLNDSKKRELLHYQRSKRLSA